jgi:CRISPR-associated endonuclease/helicase Cas3
MNPLLAQDFSEFFHELWGYEPFPWQRELTRRLCAGRAPDYISVPTGSGKTACLDAALFALAVQATMPVAERTQGRRIFFIVNRRVIVDEAYHRAGQLCRKLQDTAGNTQTSLVAAALRGLSADSDAPPLARVQLRGGIFRDRSWAGSLLQPMIICSTVDQAGSRLLFRGYGVSPQARPIHAALVAQDSMLIIDEAHISRPFIQTLEWVKRYRLHQPAGGAAIQLPFQLVQMTATPPAEVSDDQKIALSPEDRAQPILKSRLSASKPARLVAGPNPKGKAREEQIAAQITAEALALLQNQSPDSSDEETGEPQQDPARPINTPVKNKFPRSIAIMVNRVITARTIQRMMEKHFPGQVRLLIGRLRPIDREAVTKDLQERLKTGAANPAFDASPLIVVSTQCLEVGADLDFDTLVTEAASLDALRQRFGRLNRGGRAIAARAAIVLPGDQFKKLSELDDKAPCDLIYGNAIPRTWHWLNHLAQDGVVDFGITPLSAEVEDLRKRDATELAGLLSPTSDAPVLLPAYLDCWVQTNSSPDADPDVALFLHGPQRGAAEVQVAWRGDLPEVDDANIWSDTISLCPPTTAECLPVPVHVFRNWLLSRKPLKDIAADVDAVGFSEEDDERKRNGPEEPRRAFIWRGADDSAFARGGTDLRPGDTIILRAQDGGWNELGHLPDAPDDPQKSLDKPLNLVGLRKIDVAEQAAVATRRRAIFRVHPAVRETPVSGSAASELFRMARDVEQDWSIPQIREIVGQVAQEAPSGWPLTQQENLVLRHLADRGSRLVVEPYPDNQGFVLSASELLPAADSADYSTSDADDSDALLETSQPQELGSHTSDVLAQLEASLAQLPLAGQREALLAAASLHDWGKVDPRFQALLRGTTPFAAMAATTFLAKSAGIPISAAARRETRSRARLPEGFRHEMLSVQIAETSVGNSELPKDVELRDLALHLVATHHGYGRPFAPFVEDKTPPDINFPIDGKIISLTAANRIARAPHALDSGIAERFWHLTRRHGWWGLAYLEAVLRLADQTASAHPKTDSPS